MCILFDLLKDDFYLIILCSMSVADPGFPRGGGTNSPWGGRQHTILPKIPKKLHEIERIWAPGGGASKILLCRSATECSMLCDHFHSISHQIVLDFICLLSWLTPEEIPLEAKQRHGCILHTLASLRSPFSVIGPIMILEVNRQLCWRQIALV